MKNLLLAVTVALIFTACGKDGINGLNGQNGATGTNGIDGVNPTSVVSVPLCSDTPSYPSVFVEYGICIDNQLYAVYSANGGFLTLLTPGAYTSNAIGSSCNFSVASDCQVIR